MSTVPLQHNQFSSTPGGAMLRIEAPEKETIRVPITATLFKYDDTDDHLRKNRQLPNDMDNSVTSVTVAESSDDEMDRDYCQVVQFASALEGQERDYYFFPNLQEQQEELIRTSMSRISSDDTDVSIDTVSVGEVINFIDSRDKGSPQKTSELGIYTEMEGAAPRNTEVFSRKIMLGDWEMVYDVINRVEKKKIKPLSDWKMVHDIIQRVDGTSKGNTATLSEWKMIHDAIRNEGGKSNRLELVYRTEGTTRQHEIEHDQLKKIQEKPIGSEGVKRSLTKVKHHKSFQSDLDPANRNELDIEWHEPKSNDTNQRRKVQLERGKYHLMLLDVAVEIVAAETVRRQLEDRMKVEQASRENIQREKALRLQEAAERSHVSIHFT